MEQLTFAAGASAATAVPDPAAPGYEIERELAAAGAGRVAGVDEVGRGAWAGPVTVCAVIVRSGFPAPPAGLTDSKRLSPVRRAAIAGELLSWVEAFAIGEAGPAVYLATTRDFRTVERHGIVKQPEDKNAALLPHRIGGKWILFHRPMTAFGMESTLRITVGTPAENRRLIKGLRTALGKKGP